MRGQRRSIARHQGVAGHVDDVARRPHLQLQHARQHQGPRNGAYAELKTDVAGLGGDSRFFRATGDARYYYEIFEDIVGIGRAQAAVISWGLAMTICASSTTSSWAVAGRGFASSGIGPRDISSLDSRSNAIGGTTYVGLSAEVQFLIFGLPRELGLEGAVFADAGTPSATRARPSST